MFNTFHFGTQVPSIGRPMLYRCAAAPPHNVDEEHSFGAYFFFIVLLISAMTALPVRYGEWLGGVTCC